MPGVKAGIFWRCIVAEGGIATKYIKSVISVVVPTRNRHEELAWCLRAFCSQETGDFEVVVFDNSDPPLKALAKKVVESSGVPQAKYFASRLPLAMTDSWEEALACISGEYFTVIGDDDTVMPYGLDVLEMLVGRHPDEIINWQPPWYYWSNCPNTDVADTFRLPTPRHVLLRQLSETQLKKVCAYDDEFTKLPTVYTSLIPTRLYRELKDRLGRFFHTRSPDIGAAFMIGATTTSFLKSPLPFFVAGISGRSNGGANNAKCVERDEKSPRTPSQIKDFMDLSRKANYGFHPYFEGLPVTYAFEVASSAMTIRDLLESTNASSSTIKIDLAAMLQRASLQVNQLSEGKRSEAWDQIVSWASMRGGKTLRMARKSVEMAQLISGNAGDTRVEPKLRVGWLPEHARFMGRVPRERVSNVSDFADFIAPLYRYKEFAESRQLPKCLDLRASGRLDAWQRFKRLLPVWQSTFRHLLHPHSLS